jgi:hypothetical protein
MFEVSLEGPVGGNPFVDVQIGAEFRLGDRVVRPEGFYDGNGIYKIRFMPDEEGTWQYSTVSDIPQFAGRKGSFICTAPSEGNHGPVCVDRNNPRKLCYADGTAYISIGTTCYAWTHQGGQMEEQTLKTLQNAPFNKVRMCVFPKSYPYNENEPECYPYEGRPMKDWDLKRPNPAFWQHFEKRIQQLADMGIEADVIMFHPYDRWGFMDMGDENNRFYLRYLVARLSAFRNVWWSMANEYDLFEGWEPKWWDEYISLVNRLDPYGHMCGIHNCKVWYDHNNPGLSHASIQSDDFSAIESNFEKYPAKPHIFDECRYEGDIEQSWGRLSPEEMTRHFWMGFLGGCYVGHGETYMHPDDLLWWSKGGVLRGKSPARIRFLKEILADLPFQEMKPDFSQVPRTFIFAKPGEHYLIYFAEAGKFGMDLPVGAVYGLEVIDTWNMKKTPQGTVKGGKFEYAGKKDLALRLSVRG